MDVDLTSDAMVDLDVLGSRLLRLDRQKWLVEATTKTKLRTFLDIYNANEPKALILTFMSRSQRSLLSKLKLGILPLEIESGRWKDDAIEERICRLCNDQLLGDEYHFVLFCDSLVDERTQFYIELCNRVDMDVHAPQEAQLKCMFEKESLKTTGKHIEIMFNRRKELLYQKIEKDKR